MAESGASVLVADLDAERAGQVASQVGGHAIPLESAVGTPCDVYAPCAVGATLHAGSIPRLACDIVAGAANTQLATPEDAERLHERGILYAPDYVINGGGAMAFTLIYRGIDEMGEVEHRVRGIGQRLEAVFREAADDDVSPVTAARAHAERVLSRGPRAGRASSFEDMRGAGEVTRGSR